MALRRRFGVDPVTREQHGPTDEAGDIAEARHTEAVAAPYGFDTPPVSEVLQAETGGPDEAIPVRLTNPVNINQLPTHVGGMFSKSLAASPAAPVRILNADPRRAKITLAGSVVVAIGRSQAEAADADAFRLEANQGPFPFHFTEELWARSTGAAGRISVAVEQWAR